MTSGHLYSVMASPWYWVGVALWLTFGFALRFFCRWEAWPIKPLHTTMKPAISTVDLMDRLKTDLGWYMPAQVENDGMEHFVGLSLGINGGYAGWNVWWPKWRTTPRIRWAAMLWRR